MKRIAHVDSNQRTILNVSLSEDDAPLEPGTMLEIDAIEQGYIRVQNNIEPPPDFDQMATALRIENGFKGAFQEAFTGDPMATGSLPSRFDQFRQTGDYSLFLQSLILVLQSLDPEHAAEIAAELLILAVRCKMPMAFVQDMQNAFSNDATS